MRIVSKPIYSPVSCQEASEFLDAELLALGDKNICHERTKAQKHDKKKLKLSHKIPIIYSVTGLQILT
jgi:hypothetical protein